MLAACATATMTTPSRTASEQLLLSHAAEQAAGRFKLPFPRGTAVFLDAANFKGEGSEYALSAVRAAFSRQGMVLAQTREAAQTVVELRMGAMSLDQMNWLVGLPAMSLPVLSSWSTFSTPELSLYSRKDRSAVAEISAFAYDAKTGAPVAIPDHAAGTTEVRSHKLLMVFSWGKQEVRPGDEALQGGPWWKVW